MWQRKKLESTTSSSNLVLSAPQRERQFKEALTGGSGEQLQRSQIREEEAQQQLFKDSSKFQKLEISKSYSSQQFSTSSMSSTSTSSTTSAEKR